MNNEFDPNRTLDDIIHAVLNIALVNADATAGSLMLVDDDRRELHIKARLGPPRSKRREEPSFSMNDKSIACDVVEQCQSRIVNDVNKESDFLITGSGSPNFKSLLCVPIIAKDKVIGVINADHGDTNHFDESHRTGMEDIARELGEVIIDRITVPEALQKITETLGHESIDGGIDQTLTNIADDIRNALGANVVLLYQYNSIDDEFIRTRDGGPTISGEIKYPEFMKTRVYKKDVPFQILIGGKAVYISDTNASTDDTLGLKHTLTRHGEMHPDRERFCVREEIKSMVALPLIDKYGGEKSEGTTNSDEYVGVMFVNYRQKHLFSIEEQSALKSFANAAAFAILSARREERSQKEKTGLYFRIDPKAHRLLDRRCDEGRKFLERFSEKGEEQECFVIAVDIRRSTDLMLNAISDHHFAEFIMEVEDKLKGAITRNWGIVDKFTGDGMLAYFPKFYSGSDAGIYCLKAAAECHTEFEAIYSQHRSDFQIVLDETGLGIGIDYGKVHFWMDKQELIAVGKPVVYACRFSVVDPGETVLNQQAVDGIMSRHAANLVTKMVTVSLKHQGTCLATRVRLSDDPFPLNSPEWLETDTSV